MGMILQPIQQLKLPATRQLLLKVPIPHYFRSVQLTILLVPALLDYCRGSFSYLLDLFILPREVIFNIEVLQLIVLQHVARHTAEPYMARLLDCQFTIVSVLHLLAGGVLIVI